MEGTRSSSRMSAENIGYLAEKGIHELLGKMLHHLAVQREAHPDVRPLRCWIEFLEAEMAKRSVMALRNPAAPKAEEETWVSPVERTQNEVRALHEALQAVLETPAEIAVKAQQRQDVIRKLGQGFCDLVVPVAQKLIEEHTQPVELRSIKPVPGDNNTYIYAGLVFRFATTEDNVKLLGSRHNAAKVLGHELKATGAVLDANICGLHVPLSLCVRYLGMGLWVSTQLALHPEELVYGCLDSGATVVRSDSEMNGIMRQLGERLNLKPHPAGMSHEAAKTIYGPTDLQGYRCTKEKRFYLLGLSRLLPPTAPEEGFTEDKAAYLTELLRPECVRQAPKPLNSDAFSPFLKTASDEEAVANCTRSITESLLPAVVPQLVEGATADALTGEGLVRIMHDNGVNCRYLGKLLPLTETCPARHMLVVCSEMVARAFRGIVEDEWYELGRDAGARPTDYEATAARFFHLLLDDTPEGKAFWSGGLLPRVCAKFGEHLVLMTPAMVSRKMVFRRCGDLLGVQFGMWDSDCFKEFEGCGAVPAPFGKSIQLRPVVKLPGFLKPRPAQLQVMEGRVLEAAAILEAQLEKMDKYMNIMSPALAPVLQDLAATYGQLGGERAQRAEGALLRVVKIRAMEAADDTSFSKAHADLAQFYLSMGAPDKALPQLHAAVHLLEETLGEGHATLAPILALMGHAYYAQGEPKLALESYKSAMLLLEKAFGCEHPRFAAALVHLGTFYTKQGVPLQALPFFQRALTILTEAGNPMHEADVARVHYELAANAYHLGHYKSALEQFKACQGPLERCFGPQDAAVVDCQRYILGMEHHRYPDPSEFAAAELMTIPEPTAPRLSDGAEDFSAEDAEHLQKLLNKKKFQEALPIMRRYVELQEHSAPTTEEFADVLVQYGHLLQHTGDPLAATIYARTAALREVLHGKQHVEVAGVLVMLGNSLHSQGKYWEAVAEFEKAGAIWDRNAAGHEKQQAACYEGLANLHMSQGKRALALQTWDRVLLIQRTALGEDHPDTKRTRKVMDNIYAEIARLEGDETHDRDHEGPGSHHKGHHRSDKEDHEEHHHRHKGGHHDDDREHKHRDRQWEGDRSPKKDPRDDGPESPTQKRGGDKDSNGNLASPTSEQVLTAERGSEASPSARASEVTSMSSPKFMSPSKAI